MKKITTLLVLISLVLLYFFYPKKNITKIKEISMISTIEKEFLTNFFKYSFFCDGLGYVIFYDKPMNFMTINISQDLGQPPLDYMNLVHISNKYKMQECWNIWMKYSDLFLDENFSVITTPNSDFIKIIFINHRNFKKMVDRHIQDFHQVLGSEFTAQEILNEFVKGKGYVYHTIINHDGLFGTLLGFGRNNAWEYMYQGGGGKMNHSFRYELPEGSTEMMGLSFCVISGTDETESLRTSYEQQRQKLTILYNSDNFLQQVLNKLTSDI